jgi:hypothetical protein
VLSFVLQFAQLHFDVAGRYRCVHFDIINSNAGFLFLQLFPGEQNTWSFKRRVRGPFELSLLDKWREGVAREKHCERDIIEFLGAGCWMKQRNKEVWTQRNGKPRVGAVHGASRPRKDIRSLFLSFSLLFPSWLPLVATNLPSVSSRFHLPHHLSLPCGCQGFRLALGRYANEF